MIAELFKYNCSTLFILRPVVGVGFATLQDEFGMINSYLKDESRDDLDGNMLFILFKPKDFDYFETFMEEQMEENEAFLEDYDYSGGYVVMAYRIPEALDADFELFKQGKYSKLSNLIKNSYDKQVKGFLKPIPSFQWEVFNKSESLKKELEEFLETRFEKDLELWQIPDVEGKEVLDINKFLIPEISKYEDTRNN